MDINNVTANAIVAIENYLSNPCEATVNACKAVNTIANDKHTFLACKDYIIGDIITDAVYGVVYAVAWATADIIHIPLHTDNITCVCYVAYALGITEEELLNSYLEELMVGEVV